MPNVYGAIDLQKNELRQAQIQNLASAPANPVTGQLYYNSSDSTLYFCSNAVGPVWTAAKAGAGTAAATTVTTQAVGDAAVVGALTAFAREDHKHGMPAFGAATAQTAYGAASGNGAAATIARSDHVHGTPSLSSNVASTQAIGDAATNGAGTLPAKDDHKHAMPAFGNVASETSGFGTGFANGNNATVARSDHTHGNPAHDAAAHSTIPLSGLAVPTASLNLNSQKIINLADPTAATDGANKQYVDNLAQGLDAKASVKVVETSNLASGGVPTTNFAIDSVATATGDRVLLTGQSTPANNGIWLVNSAGAWTRPTDFDNWADVPSAYVWVEQGNLRADTGWLCTSDPGGTLGTTAQTWVQFSGAGQITAGAGLTKTANTLDVVAGDTSLTVAADSVVVNTAVIATVASLGAKVDFSRTIFAGNGLTGGGDLSADRTVHVGAGNGIAVQADTVNIDYNPQISGSGTVAPLRKYSQTLTGTSSPEVVTHGLNTRDVQVSVYNSSSPYTAVEVDWDATSLTTVTIRYSPNLGSTYRIVVAG